MDTTALRMKKKQVSIQICKIGGRIKLLNSVRLTRQQLLVGEADPHPVCSGYPFFFLMC